LALASGVAAASSETPPTTWVRSGRNLHVFTAKPGIAGFVSVPRVIIGLENAVICADEITDSVVRVCTALAAAPPEEVSGPGIPAGWRCFRGIRPTAASVPEDCDGIFLALVPLPDAAIDLSGGIPISRSAWLHGHPPSIRIVGAAALPGSVTIDGQDALGSDGNVWVAPEWDTEGSHTVRYAGISRAYEITRSLQSWDRWDAHVGNGLVLCGALATQGASQPIFASAAGPTWLIGRVPGEIVQAGPGKSAAVTLCAPPFEAIWAVRVHAGRGRNRQLPQLIGRAAHPDAARPRAPRAATRLWCQLLREGMRDLKHWQGSDQEAARLWMEYRQLARALWRRSR
jgi:hypothetical protein